MVSKLNTFNWIASAYDRLVKVVFGSALLDAQLSFIDEVKDHDAILILGGGSGEFLAALLNRKPVIKVCYIEASQKMLTLSKTRTLNYTNVDFIHGTEDNIPESPFNVVVTNFFFDLFPQHDLNEVIGKIDKHLLPGGKWIVTDFENSSRLSHQILLSAMYFFFKITGSIRATNLPEWRTVLTSRKFYIKNEKVFRKGFIRSTLLYKADR